ncbi:MAG: SprT-like domain-containing protein [Hyphomicrobiaceae bacterium]|nr:SprT-like domain-containing protein [Hyphomicrobiaceae bacterium]
MHRLIATARPLGRATRGLMRRVLTTTAWLLVIMLALGFILWDSDWWALRDRIERFHAALFGTYITPECRSDPANCDRRKPPMAPPSQACSARPGLELHCQLQTLYAYFNKELFENRLPPVLITLQRKPGAGGYYSYRRFRNAKGGRIDEIALNPNYFRKLTMRDLAAILVHEMVHLEQAHFGHPGAGGLHNAEWGKLMQRVGLAPSSTGRPGGQTTGVDMAHYIIKGGRFDIVAKRHPLIQSPTIAWME